MQLLLIWILTPAGKIPISLYAVKTDSNQITFIADQKTVQHALLMKALHMHLQTQASHHIDHILLTVFFISP